MRLIIFEGSRGVGKSTVARKIRDKVSEVTLVNPTGFHLDNKDGHDKVYDYYFNWYKFLRDMRGHDSTFVFDRFFFSERVYSELYKNYDFSADYESLARSLSFNAMADEVDVIFLTIEDEEELKERLIRDKVPFGKAEESTAETLKQQNLYKNIMNDFGLRYTSDSVRLHNIDTSGKTLEDIEREVFKIVGGN